MPQQTCFQECRNCREAKEGPQLPTMLHLPEEEAAVQLFATLQSAPVRTAGKRRQVVVSVYGVCVCVCV